MDNQTETTETTEPTKAADTTEDGSRNLPSAQGDGDHGAEATDETQQSEPVGTSER